MFAARETVSDAEAAGDAEAGHAANGRADTQNQ